MGKLNPETFPFHFWEYLKLLVWNVNLVPTISQLKINLHRDKENDAEQKLLAIQVLNSKEERLLGECSIRTGCKYLLLAL